MKEGENMCHGMGQHNDREIFTDDYLNSQEEFFNEKGEWNCFPDSAYKEMIDEFDISDNTTGLDICCGSGEIARVIKSKYIDGIDISSALIVKAKSLRKVIKGDAHFPQDYFKKEYDWISFIGALHHLKYPNVALYNASLLLKDNGKMVFFEPNALHPQRALFFNTHLWKNVSKEEYALNPYKVEEFLKYIGLEVTKLRFLSPPYKKMGLSAKLQQIVKNIDSKYFQTFWIMVAEKSGKTKSKMPKMQ